MQNAVNPAANSWSVARLLGPLASLQLAVVLISLYAVVLAWATLVESRHGTAAAHFGIYDTGWFVALNVLLGLNVLCAALVRFPWRRRQAGFVVTHAGILVLLVGCWVSHRGGIEAQLPVFEGQAAHLAFQDSHHFELLSETLGEVDAPVGSDLSAEEPIRVPLVAGPFSWNRYAELPWFPWRLARRGQGVVYDEGGIVLEVLDYTSKPHSTARVRLTVDGKSEEFDLAASSEEPMRGDQRHIVTGKRRRVVVTMPLDQVDLGFQVYLRKFQRKLDPGSGMASHYSSRVDFRDRGDPPKKLLENVLITLNAPVDFTDPWTGRTYRLFQSSFSGPWTPGNPEFDRLAGNDRSRDRIYLSRLSVNYDPGRGLKYAGCFLVVAGIAMLYYMRRFRKSNRTAGFFRRKIAGGCLLAVLLVPGGGRAADHDELDWSAWQRMPVFGEGRVVPLDTFARETVEAVCGRVDPKLAPSRMPSDSESVKAIFPDGRPRKFSSAELLFSWLVEPERWESVPFLAADHKQLREEVLQLPPRDPNGHRLRHALPADVENSDELARRWRELQRRADAEGKGFRLSGVDKKIKELVDAYGHYRLLTFNPKSEEVPRRFYARTSSAAAAWRKLAGDSRCARRVSSDQETRRLMVQAGESLQKLIAQVHGEGFSLDKIEPSVTAFQQAGEQLAARLNDSDDNVLAELAANMNRQATEMHLALYDNGETLRLVPALSPGALEENRTPSDDASPWLGFQSLMFGSEDLLRAYPQDELHAVRKAFAEVKAVYLDHKTADRSRKFAVAMNRFANAVRTLGDRIEPLREKLPLRHRDQNLIDATAYPLPGSTDAEVFYNQFDPFFWSWLVSVVAMLCLSLAFGIMRKPMFWLGVATLFVAQTFTVAGFGLRWYVTGLVPLTGMFETVVLVALCVAILGLWFALLPLVWPGLQAAWRWTGRPWTQPTILADVILYLPQLGLMVWLFLKLGKMPGASSPGYFNLLPRINSGNSLPTLTSVMVWLVGLCVLATAVYYLPRMAVALVVSLHTVPRELVRRGIAATMDQALQRKLFALVGAGVGFLVALIAYYAPSTVLDRGIGAPMPILRDNFWLFVHVLTITASYGAGALAWGLSNIALGVYLLGRYRAGRPPETCATLAAYAYKAIQVAVLLLAAGTVLGALWADVAWGRFWSWDAKETWALISLLVYMIILHGRYAGWSGDFGMAIGSVLGATAILIAWYGVNFLLGSGLHSYGSGTGGQWGIGIAVTLNWLFLLAAAMRYQIKIHGGRSECEKDETT